MTSPGPTIKSFHKRLYTVLPRGVAIPCVHPNSTEAYFPSSPYFNPSTPPPSFHPSNPHLLSTTCLPIEARTEPEAPNFGHSQRAHTGPTPSSLAINPPHLSNSSSTSFNGILLSNLHAPPFFLYQPFTPPSSLPASVLDPCSPLCSSSTSQPHFHFNVGAYGIPKHHPSSIKPGYDGASDMDPWTQGPKLTDGLDLTVQVSEDAYFVRDNAMGVVDGIGGWSHTRMLSGPIFHCPTFIFTITFSFTEGRTISVGALCSTFDALLL